MQFVRAQHRGGRWLLYWATPCWRGAGARLAKLGGQIGLAGVMGVGRGWLWVVLWGGLGCGASLTSGSGLPQPAQDPERQRLRRLAPDLVARAEAVARLRAGGAVAPERGAGGLAAQEAALWQAAQAAAEQAAAEQAAVDQTVDQVAGGEQVRPLPLGQSAVALAAAQEAYGQLSACSQGRCGRGLTSAQRRILVGWGAVYLAVAQSLGAKPAELAVLRGALQQASESRGIRPLAALLAEAEGLLGGQSGFASAPAVAVLEAAQLRGLPVALLDEERLGWVVGKPRGLDIAKWSYALQSLARLYPGWQSLVWGRGPLAEQLYGQLRRGGATPLRSEANAADGQGVVLQRVPRTDGSKH